MPQRRNLSRADAAVAAISITLSKSPILLLSNSLLFVAHVPLLLLRSNIAEGEVIEHVHK